MSESSHLFQIAAQLGKGTAPAASAGLSQAPRREDVVRLLDEARALMFPNHYGVFCHAEASAACVTERLGSLERRLAGLIHGATPHDCSSCSTTCLPFERAYATARSWIARLPALRDALQRDVEAAYAGDPAAKGHDEVLLAYPGFYAVLVYRLAHALLELGVPLIPRMMTEYAHSVTGIDIHPGARIGSDFFIDHGTGVVIGETTIIGNRVKLYQGVTLGALSFPNDETGNIVRNLKRHPTIEDDVVIYAGATILGGDTVVGRGSEIGGNVWLIKSVPPYSKVLNRPQIEVRQEANAQGQR